MKKKQGVFAFFANTEKIEELSLSLLLGVQIVTVFIASPLVDNSSNHYHWITDVLLALMAFVSVFSVPPSQSAGALFLVLLFVWLDLRLAPP